MSTGVPRKLTRLVVRIDRDLRTDVSAIAARLRVDTGDTWSHAAVIRGLINIGRRVVASYPEYISLRDIFQGAHVKRGKKPGAAPTASPPTASPPTAAPPTPSIQVSPAEESTPEKPGEEPSPPLPLPVDEEEEVVYGFYYGALVDDGHGNSVAKTFFHPVPEAKFEPTPDNVEGDPKPKP